MKIFLTFSPNSFLQKCADRQTMSSLNSWELTVL
jgi:hypothetical protein